MNITQDEFDAYEDVRQSGVTNMFDVSTVSDYSGLNREQIMAIMKNYSELNEKYGDQIRDKICNTRGRCVI